jgi:hypothetical protein
MRRAVALAWIVLFAIAGIAAADSVTGSFVGNGREAKLEHIYVVPDEFFDVPGWAIVLSEKESTSERPDHDAMFNKIGDALVVNIDQEGTIVGVQVCHQQLERSGFSSAGTVEAKDFSVDNGVLKAHVTSDGEHEFFGDKWQIDLRIEVTLPKK